MIFDFAAKLFEMSLDTGMRAVVKLAQFACGGWASWG
jgi:hypothetical protein